MPDQLKPCPCCGGTTRIVGETSRAEWCQSCGHLFPVPSKAEPAPQGKPHECPYGGCRMGRPAMVSRGTPEATIEMADEVWLCGAGGWLCDRCKLDAAGRLTEMICKALDRIYTEMK